MASSTISPTKRKGGSFLIEQTTPEQVFSPEDFTEEHRAIARTTEEFWTKEIAPNVDAIQHQEPGVAVSVLRKAGELGLTSVHLPEKYGGMEMDLTSAMLVAEGIAKDGSYAAWHAAQSGIGSLPLLLFGNEEQKHRYLSKVASAELIASYALSEPQAGSDALAARTRADLSPDGKHYILNGQKMWITNGGSADLYTIFAKVGGEKFTAFLVERKFPGIAPGAEEKKMGIKGSSTTAIYLDNVPVPVENVLGEIGRGHIIAFNILNIGRLKLGAIACGASKEVLRVALNYAKERKAFGKSISEFGLMKHKLAEMAIRIFAAESATYRVVGLIESHLEEFSWDQPNAAQTELKAVEEFAAECSYIKILASETLDYVTDEAVQIHGGYGYHQDYSVERAYRDSRINRIWEGTNEINRILATGILLKRAQRGQLPLVEAAIKLQADILADCTTGVGANGDAQLVAAAKMSALFALGVANQKFGAGLEDQQEVLAAITDIAMNAFATETVYLRAQKLAKLNKDGIAADFCSVFLREAMEIVECAARNLLAASSEGEALRTNLAVLRRLTEFEPLNAIAVRRRIADRLLATGRYLV
jgi:alkylation response protein AidB-like acyl-CoA dehydrogenase